MRSAVGEGQHHDQGRPNHVGQTAARLVPTGPSMSPDGAWRGSAERIRVEVIGGDRRDVRRKPTTTLGRRRHSPCEYAVLRTNRRWSSSRNRKRPVRVAASCRACAQWLRRRHSPARRRQLTADDRALIPRGDTRLHTKHSRGQTCMVTRCGNTTHEGHQNRLTPMPGRQETPRREDGGPTNAARTQARGPGRPGRESRRRKSSCMGRL